MHHPAGLARLFLAHDAQGVVGRGTGMDHQRFTAGPRGADMGTEAFALPFEVAGQPEIVQPGLADRHHLGVVGQRDQFRHRRLGAVFMVRMHAHGRVDIRMRFGERADFGEFFQFHADAQRVAHLVGRHQVEHLGQLAGEVGEIDVAVGIDVHFRYKIKYKMQGS